MGSLPCSWHADLFPADPAFWQDEIVAFLKRRPDLNRTEAQVIAEGGGHPGVGPLAGSDRHGATTALTEPFPSE